MRYQDKFNYSGVDRTRRVSSLLRRELSLALQNKVADPRIGRVTITEIVLSKDLKHAKVYVTGCDSSEELRTSLSALNSAKSFIRHQLASTLNLKYTPTFRFIADDLPERSARVLDLIDKVSQTSK